MERALEVTVSISVLAFLALIYVYILYIFAQLFQIHKATARGQPNGVEAPAQEVAQS